MDPSLLPYPAKHRLTDTQQPVGQMLPQGLGIAGSWIPVVDQGLVNAQLQYQVRQVDIAYDRLDQAFSASRTCNLD